MANLRVQRRRGTRGDDGASLVEFALILPVFMMLLLGMFSGGVVLNDKQELTHAVREGARYGAAIPAKDFSGDDLADSIRDYVILTSNGLLDSSSEVCVAIVRGTPDADAQESADGKPANTYLDFEVVSATTTNTACDASETYKRPTATGDTGQRVQVTAEHPGQIELGLFGSISVTLEGAATAKSEYDD
jgi:Flp pilus assembly protein TadG